MHEIEGHKLVEYISGTNSYSIEFMVQKQTKT